MFLWNLVNLFNGMVNLHFMEYFGVHYFMNTTTEFCKFTLYHAVLQKLFTIYRIFLTQPLESIYIFMSSTSGDYCDILFLCVVFCFPSIALLFKLMLWIQYGKGVVILDNPVLPLSSVRLLQDFPHLGWWCGMYITFYYVEMCFL